MQDDVLIKNILLLLLVLIFRVSIGTYYCHVPLIEVLLSNEDISIVTRVRMEEL